MTGVFAAVRSACARVAEHARFVTIDDAALDRFVAAQSDLPAPSGSDPAHQPFADPATTLAFVVTLDAVNFGSGWFPELRKRPGMSGYFTVSTSLRSSAADQVPPRARACSVSRSVIATVEPWRSSGNQPEPKLTASRTST